MNKTKRKMVKRKKGNRKRRRTIKYKGGTENGKETDTYTITAYMWPKNTPSQTDGTNKMMYIVDLKKKYKDYMSRVFDSIDDAENWVDYTLKNKSVVPVGVQVQSKSLVVYTPLHILNADQ